MSRSSGRPPRGRFGAVSLLVVAAMLGAAGLPFGPHPAHGESPPNHLVVSELTTGAGSASDEFIELHNPTADPLPLEGLEVVYVSASGLSVSRRAAWDAGSAEVPPGGHVLIANELGVYAGIADVQYSSGMAAAGGSVALRIQGGSAAIDALGWGTASSPWLEGTPASAPAAGASLERLPGGTLGSGWDTDDNAADFVERLVPEPQNLASAPTPTPDPTAPSPSLTPDPTAPSPSATPAPSTTPVPTSDPTPSPENSVHVSTARELADGTVVTIEATSLTGSGFTEGGGYVADDSGGIAVLLSSGSFERGARLRVRGSVDDRFSQRTIRAVGSDITVLGDGDEPPPVVRQTGSVDESVEGTLVRVAGSVVGSPTTLSAGLAYDLDDASGAVRVVVGSALGIDTSGWIAGARVELLGVVGQRDSTGSGTTGYRVQPRDAADVLSVAGPSPTTSAGPTPSPGPSEPVPSASPPADGLLSIAEARSRPKNARVRVRGTVTLPPGLVDPISAVIQDGSGAILLRVGDEVGALARGDRIDVDGVRSTLRGMETLRVTTPARHLGDASEPVPADVRTGDAGESMEARLVRVRGAVVATARRTASGSVSFELDDGSGPLRIFMAAPLGGEPAGLVAGAWVEATGVLGQETTGVQPLRGYRVWPRSATEVSVLAAPAGSDGTSSRGADESRDSAGGGAARGAASGPGSSLAGVDQAGLSGARVGATLVHGPWPELSLGGLLWDGERLVAVASASEDVVSRVLADRRPPLSVELTGLAADGTSTELGLPRVRLGSGNGQAVVRDAAPHPPIAGLPEEGSAWVSVIGELPDRSAAPRLDASGQLVELRLHCDDAGALPTGRVQVTGIGVAEPPGILVPCGGVRPAPDLIAGPPPDAAEPPPLRQASMDAPAAQPAETTDLRGVAAGLLVAAACVVAGSGLIARRLDPDPQAPFDGASEGETDEPGEAEEDPAPRPLTLVSVPHERGHR